MEPSHSGVEGPCPPQFPLPVMGTQVLKGSKCHASLNHARKTPADPTGPAVKEPPASLLPTLHPSPARQALAY